MGNSVTSKGTKGGKLRYQKRWRIEDLGILRQDGGWRMEDEG